MIRSLTTFRSMPPCVLYLAHRFAWVAGGDAHFITSPATRQELRRVREHLPGLPSGSPDL